MAKGRNYAIAVLRNRIRETHPALYGLILRVEMLKVKGDTLKDLLRRVCD